MCEFIYQNIKNKICIFFHCTKLSRYFYIACIQTALNERLGTAEDKKRALERNPKPTDEQVKEIQKLKDRIESTTKDSEDRYKYYDMSGVNI
jgi:hypothetical protein